MAANSKIEWCDRLGMLLVVAIFAQGYAITNIKPEVWKISKGFDVMGVQVSAAGIAALLASEFVAGEHVVSPSFVFGGDPNPVSLFGFPVLVAVASRPADGSLARDSADFLAHLKGKSFSFPETRATSARQPQFFLRFGAVVTAEKCRRPPLGRFANGNASAIVALRAKPIESRPIRIEDLNWLPCLATKAPLQAGGDFRNVLVGRNAGFCSSKFRRT